VSCFDTPARSALLAPAGSLSTWGPVRCPCAPFWPSELDVTSLSWINVNLAQNQSRLVESVVCFCDQSGTACQRLFLSSRLSFHSRTLSACLSVRLSVCLSLFVCLSGGGAFAPVCTTTVAAGRLTACRRPDRPSLRASPAGRPLACPFLVGCSLGPRAAPTKDKGFPKPSSSRERGRERERARESERGRRLTC
jgi:hypothetical protein